MPKPTQPARKLFGVSLLLLLLVIAACEDDPAARPETYPIVLYGESVEAVTDIRMYTGAGEITDPAKIQAYVAGWRYFNGDEEGKGEPFVTFTSERQATFSVWFDDVAPQPGQIGFSVERNGNQFRFTSDSEIPVSSDRPEKTVRAILKHLHPVSTYPTATGLRYATKQVAVAQGTTAHLAFPVIVFQTSYGSPAIDQHYVIKGVQYNEFNEDAIAALGATDTLAVRTFHVHAKIKP